MKSTIELTGTNRLNTNMKTFTQFIESADFQPPHGHTITGSSGLKGGKYKFDSQTGLYHKVGNRGKFNTTIPVSAVWNSKGGKHEMFGWHKEVKD